MGDQNITALPVKTAPAAGDQMMMIDQAEGYLIDYKQLAKAMLDELRTKEYADLGTTAKTVLAALNELNSNCTQNLIRVGNSGGYIKMGRIVVVSFQYIFTNDYTSWKVIEELSFPVGAINYPTLNGIIPSNGTTAVCAINMNGKFVISKDVLAGTLIQVSGSYMTYV